MRPHHTKRLAESITRLAAEFLSRQLSRPESLVTVTGTRLDKSGHSAIIFITVYPLTDEEKALAETRIHRSELRDFLDDRLRGSALTHVDFVPDARIKRD